MARIEHKDIGDRATPQATFTVGGSPTDPTQIIVREQDADGVETVVTTASSPGTLTTASTPLARMSAGVFKLSPGEALTKEGYWFYRFEATGTAESAKDFQYVVDPSEFFNAAGLNARALVGLAETKDWLQVQNIDTSNDFELVRVINDVSDRFHYESGREFKVANSNPDTRTFFVDELACYAHTLNVGDLTSLTTSPAVRFLASDWTTVAASVPNTDIILHPEERPPWEPARRLIFRPSAVISLSPGMRVEVTGNWGFPVVPGNVRQAVLDAVASVMDRDVEHYRQDLGPSTGGEGTNVVVFAGRSQMLSLPPTSLAVARSYSDPLVA